MKPVRALLAGVLGLAAILGSAASWTGAQSVANPVRYYFSVSGADLNDGRTPETPKRSLSLVSGLLQPGVEVLLRRGDTWTETELSWDLSGRQGAPGSRMRIGAYGPESAPRPVVSVTSANAGALLVLADTRHLSVEDLDLRGGASWRAARVEGASRAIAFDRVTVGRLVRRTADRNPLEGGGEDPPPNGGGGPAIYYVSSSEGSDNNSGLDPAHPRRSLHRIVDTAPQTSGYQPLLVPGVTVLLKRGDRWYNNDVNPLDPNGLPYGDLTFRFKDLWDGTSNPEPMAIGAYGSGDRPIVADMNRYPGSTWDPVIEEGISAHRRTQQESASAYDQVYRLYVDGEVFSKVDLVTSLVDKTYCVVWDPIEQVSYIYLKAASFGASSEVETIEHPDNFTVGGVFVHIQNVANLTIENVEFRGGNVGTALALWAPTQNVTLRNLTLRQFRHYGIAFGLDTPDEPTTKLHRNPRVMDCTIDKVWSAAMNVEPLHWVNGSEPLVTSASDPRGDGDLGIQYIRRIPSEDPPPGNQVGNVNGANGRPPGGDGIFFENVDGGLAQGNVITNMGHSGIGNEISHASQFGAKNCVIERNDVSKGASSYCRGFSFSGPGSMCTNIRIRRNHFHSLTQGSHFGGSRNYVYSNVFDGVSVTTSCTDLLGPYALDAFVGAPIRDGQPIPGLIFEMKQCVIANNTFSGAPVDLFFSAGGSVAGDNLAPADSNQIVNNLFLDWSADHQHNVAAITPSSYNCVSEFDRLWAPHAGSYAIYESPLFEPYLELRGNGFSKSGGNQDVLGISSVPGDSVLTVPEMQAQFGFSGNQFADARLIGTATSPVARYRPNGDSPFLKGGVSVTSLLPSGEAVDYEGVALDASFATRGAFQALNVNGITGGETYFSPRTITYTQRSGVAVTLDGQPFTSGTTVCAPGEHTLIASYSGLGGEVVWTFTIQNDPIPAEIAAVNPSGGDVVNGALVKTNVTVSVTNATSTTVTRNGSAYSWPGGGTFTQDGAYVVTAATLCTSTQRSFTIDKTPPVVTGVVHGAHYNTDRTIYFNEGTAVLDGGVISTGWPVMDDGLHQLTVTDAAGNVTAITFWIQHYEEP